MAVFVRLQVISPLLTALMEMLSFCEPGLSMSAP
jgi:hypothetical protein